MINEIIIKEAVKSIVGLALAQLKRVSFKLKSTNLDVEQALFEHIREVKNWSGEVTFKDLKAAKNINDIYVDLDFYVFPRRNRFDNSEAIEKVPLNKLFEIAPSHVAILGQPGAGKTTSMKHFCRSVMLDENFDETSFKYPLLLKLREINSLPRKSGSKSLLIEYFFSVFGLIIADNEKLSPEVLHQLKERIVVDCLNRIPTLVIIEGFDELIFQKDRDIVLNELSKLATKVDNSRIVVTSRTADYFYSFENISCYELCPLSDEQIVTFANKWLGDDVTATDFLLAIKKSPFHDTTIRPLTIAHLCAIYERVGKIPDKPKTIYRKIISLLLEEWDEQRNLKRLSKYASFEVDRKLEFLSSIAFHLTVATHATSFSKAELQIIYKKINDDFDLHKEEEQNVVKEIESHTGLFIESSNQSYEFAHKLLQEYLTADYIVKLPSIPLRKNLIEKLSNEMAIAVAISSKPSEYFCEFVMGIMQFKISFRFIRSFVNRLLIEKPEFNKSPKVGLVAMCLYSRYVNSSGNSSQLNLFLIDDLIDEFEMFIKSIFKRNAISEILRYYKISNLLESTNSVKILELTQNEPGEKWSLEFPKKLYCRETFLDTTKHLEVNKF
jgi:hypothetical protein